MLCENLFLFNSLNVFFFPPFSCRDMWRSSFIIIIIVLNCPRKHFRRYLFILPLILQLLFCKEYTHLFFLMRKYILATLVLFPQPLDSCHMFSSTNHVGLHYIYIHMTKIQWVATTQGIYIYGLQYIILVNLLPRWGACFLLVTTGEKFFFMKSLNHLLLTKKPFFFFLAGKSKKIQKGVLEILYDLWIVCGSALYYMCSNVQSNTIKDIQRYIRFGATPTCLANTIIKICWFSHLDEDGYHRLPYI